MKVNGTTRVALIAAYGLNWQRALPKAAILTTDQKFDARLFAGALLWKAVIAAHLQEKLLP